MAVALVNGRLFTGTGFADRRALLIEGERITAIVAQDDPRVSGAAIVDLAGRLLLPGFIDTQVNGGGGVLFNEAPTVEGVRAIGRAHRVFGTAGFLPTLISDDLQVLARAIAAVDAAIAAGVPGVLGIHIEGPYLSSARRGIHDAGRFLELDHDAVALLSSLKAGRTLMTLAPEVASPGVIARLAQAGVILAAGHTDASYAQIAAARQAGLRGFTHLFNAMSPLTGREPGAVGAALSEDETWCGIIADGRHVAPQTLKVALRAKRHDRFMLVTDAMPVVGTGASRFNLQGRTILVEDCSCVDEAGTLAGTALDMSRAVRNAITLLGLPPAEAVRMASEYPACFLGLGASHGRLAPGYRADLVVANEDYTVVETWIGGRRSDAAQAGAA